RLQAVVKAYMGYTGRHTRSLPTLAYNAYSGHREVTVKKLAHFATVMGLAPLLLAQQAPSGPTKIQALIITGQNGHDWRATTPVLRKALEDTGKFEARVTEEFRGAGPETLAPYDLVILNYSDWRKPGLRWGERAENALLDFVRSGKGAVLYHFAAASFD